MAKLIDCSMQEFKNNIEHKQVYLFGAGARVKNVINVIGKIPIAIIDNNFDKQGNYYDYKGTRISIMGFPAFCNLIKSIDYVEKIVVLIVPAGYSYDIFMQINENEVCSDINCFILNMLIDRYTEYEFEFTEGPEKIPPKIHYCWFGRNKQSDMVKKCIESWYKFCPNYEIICWNEDNYDINKNNYMKEAYNQGKWGFVPDYARLDIIYREGGIYLDTDVELIQSLDCLRADGMFCAAVNEMAIALGAGFGAVKNHPLIRKMRDYYDDKKFIRDDGTLNLNACTIYQNEVLSENGFLTFNTYQKKEDTVIYPAGVFLSRDYTNFQTISSKTIGIHQGSGSWYTNTMKQNIYSVKLLVNNL